MPSIREQIEAVVEAKFDPNGDGSHLVSQRLLQYPVNHYELSLIKSILGPIGGEFIEEFYNIEDNTYLIWDASNGVFRNKVTGEEYLIQLFYDQFDDLVQSAVDWTFANSAGLNDWVFGTDGIDIGRTNGMYISNNGGTTNTYSNSSGVSHATIDVDVPSANKVKVKIRMKSNGEAGFDDFRIFAYNAPTTPTLDVLQSAANQELLVVGDAAFGEYEFELDNTFTGTTISLSLQWRNDGSVIGQSPAHISSFEVLYN
jgi:hypothetical protein